MTGPQYGHAGQHHGIGTPECPADLHHHHDERCEPLDEALQRIADDLGEPIEIVREMSDAIECCADEGNLEARSERRQATREAYWDSFGGPPTAANTMSGAALEAAIETATRVRVDDDIVAAFKQYGHPLPLEPNIIPALTAAFRAAGFEVEQ